jgi:DNA-binding NtrC family response regulator
VCNVLLVVGDRVTRSLIGAQLKEEGFEVTGASGIKEATLQLHNLKIKPDLLIIDALEQDLAQNTLDLLAGLCPQAPLILVHGAADYPSHLNWPGKVCGLARPVTIGQVVATVKRLLPDSNLT